MSAATIRDFRMYQVGTLTEIMIAAFLSLLVMAASLKCYLNLHQVLLKQQAIQVEQQTANRVANLFKDEIEKAGLRGCYKVDRNAIQINHNSLSVSYQSYPGVNAVVSSTKDRIRVDKRLPLKKGQRLMISDCQHAEVFTVDSWHSKEGRQIIIPAHALGNAYRYYAEMGEYVQHRYFITKGVLMRVDADGYQQTMARGIGELMFKDEIEGIYYQFSTKSNNRATIWYGYAAKQSA